MIRFDIVPQHFNITMTPLMNRAVLFILLFITLLTYNGLAQDAVVVSTGQFKVTDWQSHTSLMNVRGVTVDKRGVYWVATSGGIFTITPSVNEYKVYRNIDALSSLDVTCIKYNANQNTIYAGTFDGTIELFNEDVGFWRHNVDIQNAGDQYPKRGINDLLFKGDTAYIATDFGFVVFDLKNEVVIETVDKIGAFQQKTACRKIKFLGDTIIVATDAGVSYTTLHNNNQAQSTLRNPDIWTSYKLNGGAQVAFLGIEALGGNLYGISAKSIYQRYGDSLIVIQQVPATYQTFNGISSNGSEIVVSVDDRAYTLSGTTIGGTQTSQVNSHTYIPIGDKQLLFIYYATAGIGVYNGSAMVQYAPNAPLSNRVQDIATDAQGNLWITTSNRNIDGQGFACLQKGVWHNYSNATTPFIGTDSYTKVSPVADGTVWLSTWGKGMLHGIPEGDSLRFEYFNNHNTPLIGFANNPTFTVPGEVISDKKGNTWFVQYGDAINNGAQLFSRNSKGEFTAYYYNGPSSGVHNYMNIAVDSYGTKWMASPDDNGVTYFNEQNTKYGTWGRKLTVNEKLPDNSITALVADKNGAIWIGTPSTGLAVIFSPSVVLNGNTPSVRKITLLNTESINDILVDALNNKWVATNNGVWILNEDATDTIGTIKKKNYPALLSDQIRCLASDENTGTIYIGTLQGFNSISTLSLKPTEEFSLKCYPQPFTPGKDADMIIDGLEAESEIRIITADGLLVRDIQTRSKRAVWDGKSNDGRTVSNGVYIVLAVSNQNARTTVGKILVGNK